MTPQEKLLVRRTGVLSSSFRMVLKLAGMKIPEQLVVSDERNAQRQAGINVDDPDWEPAFRAGLTEEK